MKTFTTYAEKKAKQILNLLQGYTKGIRTTAILILLLMGVSNVSAWDIGGNNVIFYYANTGSWSGINMYYWGNGWSSNQAFAQISNTKIYYYKFDHTWTNLSGIKFNQAQDNWNKQSSGDITGNLTTSRYWKGDETTSSTILAQLNGAAKVITKISTGGNYTEQANTACVVTISGYNLAANATSTTAVSAKTGSASSASINAAYGSTITYTSNTPTGYTFKGFSTSNSTSLPSNVATSKSVIANKVGGTANTTYYAYYLATQYTITYNLNGGSGTMTPTTYNIETATFSLPEPTRNGYKFDGWYENSSFTGTAVTQIVKGTTGNKTFYAKWIQNATYSLLVEAGAGIKDVTGSTDPVTLGRSYPITATPKTGYTFSTWTANPAENATFGSATTANTTVTVKNGSVTVTASATENMSTLTTSNKYDAGDPGYEVPAASVNSIGYETTATVTATVAGNGYTFTGWTLTNCTRTDNGATNATSITVRSNGDGKAATVVANYAEDCKTAWVLAHSIDGFNTSSHPFVKKSGESTGKVAYVSLDLAANTEYTFKVKNDNKWYGNNNSNEQHWIKQTVENWDFWDDAGDCHMKTNVADTYTFKIDFSGANPKVSVYFPTAYKITYGVGKNQGTDKVTTTPSITSGSLVLASTSITFSKGDTKAGYTWKNWNSKNDGTGTVLGTGDTYVSSNRAGDITVYACYDLITYNIKYNLNGGTGATNTTYTVESATITLPTAPTKTGYTFAGWYDNANLTGNKVTQVAKGSTGDKEFWAKWTPNTYTITYKDQGNTTFSGTHASGNPTTHTYGTATTLKTASKTGYTFEGWHTDAACTNKVTSLGATAYTANITLYAKWTANQYDINYRDQGDAIFSGTHEVGYPQKHTYGTITTLKTATKTDYEFGGWFTTSTCTGSAITTLGATTYTNDITLYAKWTRVYKINYTTQGTGWTYGTKPVSAEEGKTVTFVVTPATGYRVDVSCSEVALTKNGNNYTFTMPGKDVNIKVEAKPEQYNVTLDNQGATTAGTTSITATYNAAMPSITAPTKTGYTFGGYYTATNGGGTQYYKADGASAKAWTETSVTKLYAKWTANKYSVKFNANGGSGTMSNQSFEYDVPQQLTPNAFTRSGYTFVGWAESSTGDVVYTDRQLVNNLTTTNNSTVNIYAIWKEKTANTIYLKPSDEWKNDNARFAVYYWKDSENGWVDMTDIGCTGEYYKADIPVKYTDIIFCRMNPNATEYKFEDGIVWNQSEDLQVPTDDKVLYKIGKYRSDKLYLIPNAWETDDANERYAAYFFGNGETWRSMTNIGDGTYECEKPSGFSKVIFCRMNGDNSTNDWNNKWTQTNDLQIPTNGNNIYRINDGAQTYGDVKSDGTWSAGETSGWTTYTEPNITIKLVKTTNGTITLGTTTSGNSDKTFTTSINSTYVLNATPAAGYVLASCRIQMGNNPEIEGMDGDTYTFCGNATITAKFAEPVGMTQQRVHEGNLVNYNQNNGWVGGNGTKANPYTLYSDEAVRITVTALPTVAGKTAYYKFGLNEEQTENVFDWKDIDGSTATNLRITAYYKDANGNKSGEKLAITNYYKFLPLPFYLMTDPNKEINIENIEAGEDILVQFRSETPASVSLYVKKDNEAETWLKNISDADDYIYEVPDGIGLCVLHFIARASTPVHGRTFEAKADVAIYKNVIIKVNDTEGWVKNVYLWRDGSGDVLTSWPGDPVLQNFGTWRVFSVKYPYYDRFIVNNGQTDGVVQTIGWVVPEDDRCYELIAPKDFDHPAGEDDWKYGLKDAVCPPDLIVSDIENVTISVGEEKVIMPEIFVGLGHQLSDVTMNIKTTDSESKYVRLLSSGTNIILIGKAVGDFDVTVTYTLGGLTVEKTFKVTITTSNTLTITVKVPCQNSDGTFQIGWENTEHIYIHSQGTNISTEWLQMNYLGSFDNYNYLQAQVKKGTTSVDFYIYYDPDGNKTSDWWEKTKTVKGVTSDGCYVISQGKESDGARPITLEANGCKFYQVKVRMQNGKTYQSNIGFAATDILSFFAPGANEVGRNAGAVIVYENNKAVKLIEPGRFETSNVYTASVDERDHTLTDIAPYTGNFYIRTHGTSHEKVGFNNGKGWNSIKDLTAVEKDSVRFTKFASREGEFYNHYWVQAMNSGPEYDGKDVSACVANDYNDDLAGKLMKDKNTTATGNIKLGGKGKTINVRFGYDPRTNYFARAVLLGSEYENYLNMHCDNAYADKNCTKKLPYGNNNNITENKFRDISNWVYERDIYVNITNSTPSASVYVESKSPHVGEDGKNVVYNHLLGYVTNEVTGVESETPIQRVVIGSGTDNGVYLVRVVYDFKTNRIITAWMPQGTIEVSTEKTINADVLFVRKENEEVPQINLSSQGKIKSLESMFFAMEFHRVDKNPANRHQEQYWFTLPFDCKVGSISGVHGYMQIWGIQRYNGKKRAENGWFNPSTTFWEWLTPDDVMHAGEGYLLVFDKKTAPWNEIEVDKTDADGNIIYEKDAYGNIRYENGKPKAEKEIISLMRLYFPSTESGFDMQQQSDEHLMRTYENHTCTITTANRYLQDSNWKVIGTTSYNNAGISGYTKDSDPKYDELSDAPSFRYQYEYKMSNDNKKFWYKYTPENGQTATYKSFYGYMVQFAGTINWQPIMSETVPEKIAARRYVPANERTSYTTRLELANAAGEVQDLTFVALDEKATTGFDQNKDLNKVLNRGTNIYTFVAALPFAGNTLPMEKVTVPVGVRVATAGEYTFRMPDGTDGIAVTLVDNATGTHTNMLMSEYTVTLNAGTIENRFYLVVDPDRTATSVENIGEETKGDKAKDVEKFLIDGKLFIRTADGIFDAKGQRL